MMQDDTIPMLQTIQKKLQDGARTVATAESCTGGLLATYFTHLPGSSRTYRGGVSAYANQVKEKLLGVAPELLAHHGAVSASVAEAMASGVRAQLTATYGISLTGIAGPDGGTEAKPVGTVYCGFASPSGVTSFLWQISGDREKIRLEAARRALLVLLNGL